MTFEIIRDILLSELGAAVSTEKLIETAQLLSSKLEDKQIRPKKIMASMMTSSASQAWDEMWDGKKVIKSNTLAARPDVV